MLLAIIIELMFQIKERMLVLFTHQSSGDDSSHGGGSDDVWKRFWLMQIQKKETDDEP